AQQQVQNSRLPRARLADNRHDLARLDAQIDAFERLDVGPRRIAEADVLERDGTIHLSRLAAPFERNGRRPVDELENPVRRANGARGLGAEARRVAETAG